MRKFVILIERAGDNSSAYAPELPGCVATGSTEREVEANMRSAIELHLRGIEEDGLSSIAISTHIPFGVTTPQTQ